MGISSISAGAIKTIGGWNSSVFLRYIELDEAAAAKEIQKNYRRIKLNKLNQFFEFLETVFLLGCISFISTQKTAAKAAVFWVE